MCACVNLSVFVREREIEYLTIDQQNSKGPKDWVQECP